MTKFNLDGQFYEFDDRLTVKEAMQIKLKTGLKVGALFQGLEEGDPDSVAALGWIVKVRNGETGPDGRPLQFEDVDFDVLLFAKELQNQAEAEAEGSPTVPGETSGEPGPSSPALTGDSSSVTATSSPS